jgi:puromycin-sensitive aminopeptidase
LPSRYELTLAPDLEAASFDGVESVSVQVTEPVTEIVLNAVDLTVDDAWLERGDGGRVAAAVSLDPEAERATLALATTVEPGPATVHLRFHGVLNDKLRGFYRSTFEGADGRRHTLAVTQMEASHARRAFPCWDEPDLKAVFAVTLVVGDDLLALSNGATLRDEPTEDGRRRATFADTMPMSTYLVAFVVGPLELTPPVEVRGVPLRVAYAPGKGHLSRYALEVGAFCLEFLADYYGIAYPGDKLDLVAVPDFAFGAMENLGCVTFREVLLLVAPDQVTQPELQNVVDVIAHELAHMWFGDLVTMRWWNGIWLNEAFATFMEMLATDAYRPSWDRWTTFGAARSAAFDTDALATTRPIEYGVASPADAEGMFDVLTYEKGAAVVRMLEQYLGADAFRAGIRAYLSSHQYGNTETTDLWDSLESSTGEPVRRIMDSWIFQGGHPVLQAELGDGGRRLTLSQRRFAYAGGDPAGPDQRWSVPIVLRHGRHATPGGTTRVLLEGDRTEVELSEPADWVLVNSGGSGFYRVRYEPEVLRALAARAQVDLAPLERYGLVDDAWASVLAAESTVSSFCDVTRSFADETDLSVWQCLVACLGSIERLVPDPAGPGFAAFVRALVGPARHRLGDGPAPEEPPRTTTLRAVLFEAIGTTGADETARRQAAEVDRRAVDPAMANAAVRILAVDGDAGTFDDFLARSRAATNPQDTLRFLGALADFGEPDLFDRFCELTLTPAVRTQDAAFLLRRALGNRRNSARAWRFVSAEWSAINDRLPATSIPRLLEGIRSVSDSELAAGVESFLATHPVRQGAKIVDQHRERMRVSVALRQREEQALGARFG